MAVTPRTEAHVETTRPGEHDVLNPPDQNPDDKPQPKEGQLRWYAPPGHTGMAILQTRHGQAWEDVPIEQEP